jgi:acetylornithine deacetylase
MSNLEVSKDVIKRVLKELDGEELITLLSRLIQINSVTTEPASEKEIANYLVGYWKSMGMDEAHLQEVPEEELGGKDRYNVWGRLKGVGGGPSLMMGGHIDTEPIVDPEMWTHDPFSGYVDREGDAIYGLGAVNMKQGVAAETMAVHAILKAGVKLRGDLYLAGWGLENIMCRGSKYMAKHGPRPDMVLDGEMSFAYGRTIHSGCVNLTITTKGRARHISQNFVRRPDYEGMKQINAFDKMMKILLELKEVRKTFTYTRHPYLGDPLVVIGDVRTDTVGKRENYMGRPALGSSKCEVDIDVRFLPSQTVESVVADIERVIHRLWLDDHEMDATIEMWPNWVSPQEIPRDHYLIQVLRKAHREVWGEELELDIDRPESVSRIVDRCKFGGTDMGSWCAVGVPAVDYGAGAVPTTHDEHVSISQLFNCTKVYALMALEICNVVS